jgi:hypothetical protein
MFKQKLFFIVVLTAIFFIFSGCKKEREGSRYSFKDTKAFEKLSLRERNLKKLKYFKKKMDKSFHFMDMEPFLIISDLPENEMERISARSVMLPAKIMWANYFNKKPDKDITVMLFNGQKSYKRWAVQLFGDKDLSYFGYYSGRDRILVMDINTGSGTLIHELTHALIVYDFPNVPDWFNEGFASLHEGCSIRNEEIIGLLNWRLPGLLKDIETNNLRPLSEMILARDFYVHRSGSNYAQSRYFFMYLQKLGKLKQFYKVFKKEYSQIKKNDVLIIEKMFGKTIKVVEQEYIDWVKRQKLTN